KDLLAEGISARANVDWTIVLEGVEGSTEERGRHRIARLEQPDWAAGFDVVVYHVCFSGITDAAYIEDIAKAHRAGVGAVALHCTMHTFRDAEIDTWRDLLGVRTVRHEAKRPFAVENLAPDHPIMLRAGESWDTPQGELYVIEETGPRVTPLA